MVYYGAGLFQNDNDLGILSALAVEIGVDSLDVPNDEDAVRETLNSGALKRLLDQLSKPEAPPTSFPGHYNREYCLLAAAAMGLGATISAEDMAQLERVYAKAGFLSEGKAQMLEAIKGYKNDGTVWSFDGAEKSETSETSNHSDSNRAGESTETMEKSEDVIEASVPTKEILYSQKMTRRMMEYFRPDLMAESRSEEIVPDKEAACKTEPSAKPKKPTGTTGLSAKNKQRKQKRKGK